MGHEYIEMKNTAAAIEAYRRAVDVNGRDYRAWYGLGQTYEILNMYFYALYYYRKAAVLRPRDARMWIAIAQCYEKLNRDDDAIKGYERAAQHDDQEGHALLKFARLHRGRASHDEAFACYSHYARLAFGYGRRGSGRRDGRGFTPRDGAQKSEGADEAQQCLGRLLGLSGAREIGGPGDAPRDPGARRPGVVRAGGRHGDLCAIAAAKAKTVASMAWGGGRREMGSSMLMLERTSRALWTQAHSRSTSRPPRF